jgi:hypothetical protein
MFSQIDGNGDGSISKTELEQAVTAAGGTTQGADALFSQLDPNNTGSVSEQQFLQALQPPSPSGNTAEDALLALIDSVTQSASNSPSGAVSAAGSTSSSTAANTAQKALSTLLQASHGPSPSGSSGASGNGTVKSTDLASAISVYQAQLNQQLFVNMFGTGVTGV